VYFGGKFRIVDFALSNCLNSGIRRIGVLTQYKSHSLLRHLQRGWSFLRNEFNEIIDLLPAQQRMDDETLVPRHGRRGLPEPGHPARHNPEYILVLAGDHIYKMDYAADAPTTWPRGARCTVACIEVPRAEASAFGVMAVDAERRITTSSKNPPTRRPCPANPAPRWPAWASTSSTPSYLYQRSKKTCHARLQPRLRQGRDPRVVARGPGRGPPVRHVLRARAPR
jgi:glucose-1-phosphate adenylyltransferase